MVIHCQNHCNSLSKHALFVPYSITAGLYSSKYQLLLFTVPPAVSALTEQGKPGVGYQHEQSYVEIYPSGHFVLWEHVLDAKSTIFASALNKGHYGFNDFFEVEGTEPPRKRMHVVQSVPMTVGKKMQKATEVARKSVPTAAAGKPSTSTDPDYEPGEGGLGSQIMMIQTQRM